MTALPSEAKLAWMCRRGLLELDLILTKIRQVIYPGLSDQEKLLFCNFLDTPDNALLAYLLRQEEIDNKDLELANLLQKIRHLLSDM